MTLACSYSLMIGANLGEGESVTLASSAAEAVEEAERGFVGFIRECIAERQREIGPLGDVLPFKRPKKMRREPMPPWIPPIAA